MCLFGKKTYSLQHIAYNLYLEQLTILKFGCTSIFANSGKTYNLQRITYNLHRLQCINTTPSISGLR